jgi:hypothetical protein
MLEQQRLSFLLEKPHRLNRYLNIPKGRKKKEICPGYEKKGRQFLRNDCVQHVVEADVVFSSAYWQALPTPGMPPQQAAAPRESTHAA